MRYSQRDLCRQLRSQILVRIEVKQPIGIRRDLLGGPVTLITVAEKRSLENLGAFAAANCNGAIGAKRIDYQYGCCERIGGIDALRQSFCCVESENDQGNLSQASPESYRSSSCGVLARLSLSPMRWIVSHDN